MKLNLPVKIASFLALAVLLAFPLHGRERVVVPNTMSGGHIGSIGAVANTGNAVISAGEDGFLEVWSVLPDSETVERFQVSPYRIIAMAVRPGANEVSLVETDGRVFRVSAWNYRERRNIFRHEFRNPIAHISYSMGGSFLMAGGAGATGLVFINSANGNILPSPAALGGTVALAVTGRTERNMMVYLSSGFISYRDLDAGIETNRFRTQANLSSPVVFGSSRFIAGLDARDGLVVVDAVTGNVVARDASVPASSLLSSTNEALYVLINREGSAELRRQSIGQAGNLVTLASSNIPLPNPSTRVTAMCVLGDRVALGTCGGGLVLSEAGGQPRNLAAAVRATRITYIAVSGESIAFLGENGVWGFIPLDYSRLINGQTIRAEQGGADYNRITPFVSEDGSTEQFIFWQNRNARVPPSIRSPGPDVAAPGLEALYFQFPLRAVASLAGRAMFMDSAGNVSVVYPLRAAPPFQFSSVGLLDGAFIDSGRLVLGRSAAVGGTPLLSLNITTGETVPMPHPAQAAVILRNEAAGGIYAVMVSPQPGGTVTSVLRIDPANVAASQRLLEVQGEHTWFSFAKTPTGIVENAGGERATIHPIADIFTNPVAVDRTPGLPYQLFDGGRNIVSLDRDGNIAWHDGRSGIFRAIFKLQPDGWVLQTPHGIIRGATTCG